MNVFPGEIIETLQMTITIVLSHQGRPTPDSPLNLTRARDGEGFFSV